MSGPLPHRQVTTSSFRFLDFELVPRDARLLKAGREIPLRPKSLQVLLTLINARGHLVTRSQLMQEVWGKAVVTEDSINQCLVEIRRALGDQQRRIVRTIPRQGLVFTPAVSVDEADSSRRFFRWSTAGLAALGLPALVLALGFNLSKDATYQEDSGEALYRRMAHEFSYQWDGNRLPEMTAKLQHSLQFNPQHIPTLRLLGNLYLQQTLQGELARESGWQKVADTSRRIQDLSPGDSGAAGLLGCRAFLYEHDAVAATRYFNRALRDEPTDSKSAAMAAKFASATGQLDWAITLMEYLLAQEPLCAECAYTQALAFTFAENYRQAEIAIRRYRSLARGGEATLAEIIYLSGRIEEADQVIDTHPRKNWDHTAVSALVKEALGDKQGAEAVIENLHSGSKADHQLELAKLLSVRGQVDDAVQHLETAATLHAQTLPLLLSSPFFKPLHQHPRWQAIQARYGIAPGQLVGVPPLNPVGNQAIAIR